MANLSIPSIRERLFNTSKHETTTQRNSSNPFAASTFKGNVLTADVFESSTKKNEGNVAFTGKLKSSALVGSISGIGERFQNIINSVAQFGARIKESAVNGWNKLNEIEFSFAPMKEGMVSAYKSMKEGSISAYKSMKEALFTPIELGSGITAKAVANMDDMAGARELAIQHIGAWESMV